MTGPVPAMRNAARVEVMRLDSVREMEAAEVWLHAHGVPAVRAILPAGPDVDVRTLWIAAPNGTRMVARLGQWLTYEPDSGEFAVYDDEHYRQQHTGIGEAGRG